MRQTTYIQLLLVLLISCTCQQVFGQVPDTITIDNWSQHKGWVWADTDSIAINPISQDYGVLNFETGEGFGAEMPNFIDPRILMDGLPIAVLNLGNKPIKIKVKPVKQTILVGSSSFVIQPNEVRFIEYATYLSVYETKTIEGGLQISAGKFKWESTFTIKNIGKKR
jgi:hypothetical protein